MGHINNANKQESNQKIKNSGCKNINRIKNEFLRQPTSEDEPNYILKGYLIQKLISLEIDSYKIYVDNDQHDESNAQYHQSFVIPTLLVGILLVSMLVLLSPNRKKYALNILNNIMITGGMGSVFQLHDIQEGNDVISWNAEIVDNEQIRFQPEQDVIITKYNRCSGETNTDFRKEILSISDNSSTDVRQILQKTEIHAKGGTFTYFLVASKLFTAETFAEALRYCQIRDVEITYTNVFPRDCRMFLLLPVYKGGHINSDDQRERFGFRIIAPKETTTDGNRKQDSTEEKEEVLTENRKDDAKFNTNDENKKHRQNSTK